MTKEIDYEELQEFLEKLQSPQQNTKALKTLKILRGKWKLPVIYTLFKKKSFRFCELQRELSDITNAVLISVLKDLQADGIVKRSKQPDDKAVEYSLTEKGFSLFSIFIEIIRWGELYL